MAQQNAMQLINNQIEEKTFKNVYLFGGDEKYLVNQYSRKLISEIADVNDTMNYSIMKDDSIKVDEIISFCSTMPFFAERRVLEVQDSGYFKKGKQEIEDFLDELPDTAIIVFIENDIDKRTKLYKKVEKLGTIALFDTPDEQMILTWVKGMFKKDNIEISDNTIYRLVEGVGLNMNNLINEVDKLKCYCMEKGTITASDVEKLCINEVEGKVFDMMDALSQRNKTKTMKYYDDLLQLREPAMRLLFLISRQFDILLKVKHALESGADGKKIASAVKIPPFTVKKYIEQCRGYSMEQLLKCLDMCQEADTKIKTGAMRDSMAVEMLILELLCC